MLDVLKAWPGAVSASILMLRWPVKPALEARTAVPRAEVAGRRTAGHLGMEAFARDAGLLPSPWWGGAGGGGRRGGTTLGVVYPTPPTPDRLRRLGPPHQGEGATPLIRSRRPFRCTLAAIGLAAALLPTGTVAAPLKKVTVLQPVPAIDIRNAPWAVAQEMGWLAGYGLDVEIQVTKGTTILLQQILNGSAQYGMPPPEPALIALSKGAALRFFYASTTRSPFPLAVLETSAVRGPADLKGTVIGLHSMTAVQYYTTQSILRSADLKLNTDFRYVEVGAGPAALKALQDGQIAALSTNVLNYAGFENRGVRFRYITTPEVEPIFAWSLIASKTYLEANRQEAVNLARAFTMGQVYCAANPEGCIKAYFKRFPAARSPGQDEAKAVSDQVRILKTFLDYSRPAPGTPWGRYDPAAWKAVVDYMVAGGQLDRSVDPSALYTNALVDDINAIDLKAVEAVAKGSQ